MPRGLDGLKCEATLKSENIAFSGISQVFHYLRVLFHPIFVSLKTLHDTLIH